MKTLIFFMVKNIVIQVLSFCHKKFYQSYQFNSSCLLSRCQLVEIRGLLKLITRSIQKFSGRLSGQNSNLKKMTGRSINLNSNCLKSLWNIWSVFFFLAETLLCKVWWSTLEYPHFCPGTATIFLDTKVRLYFF